MCDGKLTKPTLALRREFHGHVKKQLLGPYGGEDEVLNGAVRYRYLLGRLAPRRVPETGGGVTFEAGTEPTAHSDAAFGQDGQDGQVEAPITTADSLMPSSIGLSFAVREDVNALRVAVEWGYYRPTKSDTLVTKAGNPKRVWQREQVRSVKTVDLVNGRFLAWKPLTEEGATEPTAVEVRGRCRARAGGRSVSLFLVNNQNEPVRGSGSKDLAWIFQPRLTVTAANGGDAIFIQRPTYEKIDKLEPEDKSMRMLYRRTVEFAVGHGVAVETSVSPVSPFRAVKLQTETMPIYEVERMDPPSAEEIPGAVFDMQTLAETEMGGFSALLEPLAAAYERWIDQRETEVLNPTADLKPYLDAAENNIKGCRTALQRMRVGIALIDSDKQAAAAFQFANRAMWQQRIHSIYARLVRQGHKPKLAEIDQSRSRSWRPFQLAFVLLNMPGFVDPTHQARIDFTDLLWFPTGGGKTEAYLGAAAFAMGIRRLHRDRYPLGYAGVAVLMRYTLRLLTLQQFQRATTLIAACELIRRQDVKTWGAEPFRIGLWVGNSSTPNRTNESAEIVKQKRSGDWDVNYSGNAGSRGTGTPYQLTTCPWCGRALDYNQIRVESYAKGHARTLQFCSDPKGKCDFSARKAPTEGIPIVVVDEEIYRRLPTLVIATVDKFAQMAWKGEAQMLFGRVTGKCDRHGYISPDMSDQCLAHRKSGKLPATKRQNIPHLRPPDLIIQDELHLITGPLGTLVGLYETAVDALCTWETGAGNVVLPKVIASTATIRRAAKQVQGVFARKVKVFPPPALSAEDNFFSRKTDSTDDRPSRLYVGICAPGNSRMGTLIPVYTAYMAAAQLMRSNYADSGKMVVDPWMTTVGYFNALRELGSMRRAVEDSVRNRLLRRDNVAERRSVPFASIEELTSRKSADDIPKILDKLENQFSADPRGTYRDNKHPLDVVLATNMISVGVDVDRLGLMIAAGQPKATAEYIQATSRVGRKFPGVVATVYTWSRPRDLSHYERFQHYHATFYQQVEALSVTPFAARALDRGLTGVLVSLIRQLDVTFNPNLGAQLVEKTHPIVQQAKQLLAKRADAVFGNPDVTNLVNEMVDARLDKWMSEIARDGLQFGYKQGKGIAPLLVTPEVNSSTLFTVPNSLRDVEATTGLVLKDYTLDVDEEAKDERE
ncbi:MAG: DISARM system helicase DrmA [Candidatus Promineifilaceae bacterium]